VDYLVQKARTYIYTTAMPPALAVATMKSLEIVRSDDWRRSHLAGLVQRFRSEVSGMGYQLMPSSTPIQPILVGTNESALALSRALEEQGVLVTAIRPPTVPAGEARLRVTFSASHSERDLDCLLEALQNCRPLAGAPETRSLAAV
jgi:8-amino-7-oxononanoate synthase